MKRFIPLLLLTVLLLAACGSMGPDFPDVPDPMETGQLVVTYDAATQGVRLSAGACETALSEPQVVQAVQDVAARLYYGLEPGVYCLIWGQQGDGALLITDERQLEIEAGALEYVSVLPEPEPEITTQGVR